MKLAVRPNICVCKKNTNQGEEEFWKDLAAGVPLQFLSPSPFSFSFSIQVHSTSVEMTLKKKEPSDMLAQFKRWGVHTPEEELSLFFIIFTIEFKIGFCLFDTEE